MTPKMSHVLVECLLLLVILVFIISFVEALRMRIFFSASPACPANVIGVSPENLEYLANNKHILLAARLVLCEGTYYLTEAHSVKYPPGPVDIKGFTQQKTFQQLQRDTKTCLLLLSISQRRQWVKRVGSLKRTIFYWTDLKDLRRMQWHCDLVQGRRISRRIETTIRDYLQVPEEEDYH